MKRKIIQQGNHSFTLTVPIRWVKENGLDGGSEVDVSEDDSKLVISAAAGKQPGSSVAFSLNGYHERTIRNILNQSYRKGYDMITIGYETGEQLDIVRNIVRETMLGFAVTDEKPGSCTVQNIAEPSPEKFDAIMRKLFLVIKQESEDILADVKSGRMTSMARLKGNKDMVDSYTNFLRRVAINARVGGLRNSYLIFHCVSNLSLIHHAFFYLYEFLEKQKSVKLRKDVVILLEKACTMFSEYYAAFYSRDIGKAHSIMVQKDRLVRKELYAQLQKASGAEGVVLHHIGEIIRLTQIAATTLFGLVDIGEN